MRFDRDFIGPQTVTSDDLENQGSRYSEVREALFRSAYYLTWGGESEPPLPVYNTAYRHVLAGLLNLEHPWKFLQAAKRTLLSKADMRWGDGRGFRRILHPNGVCLFGEWEIAEDAPDAFSGYFRPGAKCLIVARYSTGIGIRRGDFRTLSLVGKLFPTLDSNHSDRLETANFITQEEFGGAKSSHINDAVLHSAPNTTPWRRRLVDVPKLLVTGLALSLADTMPTIRQLYQVAEMGKPVGEPTRAPQFMRLLVHRDQQRIDGKRLDFRDEVLAQIYDRGDPEPQRHLRFEIQVADEGVTRGLLVQRRIIPNWTSLGRITFKEAVASYNGDFVLHFHHPPWRNDRNDPSSIARPGQVLLKS